MLSVLLLLAGGAAAHDYPTVERVQYVEACIRDHSDRQRQEMIYKCSCAIDAIAQQMSYEQFVEASTALYAGQVAGERGAAVRESSSGKELASAFREAVKNAFRQCMIE
jgi:hypothetical protein